MSCIYQATAYLTGPPELIEQVIASSESDYDRRVVRRGDGYVVFEEFGNYGESLTGWVVAIATKLPLVDAIATWDCEAGVAVAIGIRKGEVVYKKRYADIFTETSVDFEETDAVNANQLWLRLMGEQLCRLVPDSVSIWDRLPAYAKAVGEPE